MKKQKLSEEMLRAKVGDHIKITAIHPESAFKEDEKEITAQKEFRIWESSTNFQPISGGFMMLEVEVLENFEFKTGTEVQKGEILSIYGVKFNTIKMKIPIMVEIEQQVIDDLLIMAYEGGSTTWAILSEEANVIIEKACPEKDNLNLASSERFIKAIYSGCEIPINDAEDEEEVLGTISQKSIESALLIMAKEREDDISDIINENWNADTADILFQYAVLGEIVFG